MQVQPTSGRCRNQVVVLNGFEDHFPRSRDGTAKTDPKVRLRGLVAKASADLSIHDPVLSGEEWEQVGQLAHSLKENGWEARAKGELGIVAYLRGDTANAVALNTASFEEAKELHDIAGTIRACSFKGVGLLERKAADQALQRSAIVFSRFENW